MKVRLPFVKTAKGVSRLSIAVVALAALLEKTGLYPVDAFTRAIQTFQKEKIAEISLRAAAAGAEMAKS